MDQISEVCRRLDKKGQGWVSVNAYELALKAAGSPLQGDTAGQRLQSLLEALGECVQLEGAATTRAGGTSVPRICYVAAENRLRAALASTLFGEEKENVFATEASSLQGHRRGSAKMETRAFKTVMKAVAAVEKVSAAVEQDALASTVVGGRKPSPTGGSTEKVELNATVAQGVFAGKDYEHVQAVAAAALEDNARLRAALRIANAKSASQSRRRVPGGDGLKLGLLDGGDEREVLLDAQVALCEGREQAVESRERQVSVREAEAGRQLAEVAAVRAQLQQHEKAVDKRHRCLEDQLAVLALQEEEGALERVPRSALQLVAAAHGEHARARADQERARLLVDVQGKYSALLEAEAGLCAKLEHLEQCLDRERERNAVLRAMVEESAAAADPIGEWVPSMSCML